MGGGSYYDPAILQKLGETCQEHGLRHHLDGARLFNAVVASGSSAAAHAEPFDSISICLSKGLGAPVGSVLVGSKDFIGEAHRKRKVMGGGMRQAGYIAAAGLYALENNIDRLREDHERAAELGQVIEALPYVEELLPVETNIVVFRLKEKYPSDRFLQDLADHNIKAVPFGPQRVRMVLHLDIDDDMLDETARVLRSLG